MAIFNSYVSLPEGSSCCLSTRVDTLPGMMLNPQWHPSILKRDPPWHGWGETGWGTWETSLLNASTTKGFSCFSFNIWVWVNTYRYIFRGMNIHLPAILMFTRGTRFWHTAISWNFFQKAPPGLIRSISPTCYTPLPRCVCLALLASSAASLKALQSTCIVSMLGTWPLHRGPWRCWAWRSSICWTWR